jgi:phosphopantetheinyl transferase
MVRENDLFLQKNALGRPYLLMGNKQGPSLSFSHGKGRLWAAISGARGVGIDVAAYPEEFAAGHPFPRAFRPEELDYAGTPCHINTARAAALIWAAKEASVKVIGVGFNLFDNDLAWRLAPDEPNAERFCSDAASSEGFSS